MERPTPLTRFINLNKDLVIKMIGLPIDIIEEYGWRLEVVLTVGDDTKRYQLMKAIPIAMECRRRLIKFQGRFANERDQFFSILNDYPRGHGMYAAVARLLNQRCTEVLEALVQYEKENPLPTGKNRMRRYLDAYSDATAVQQYHRWLIFLDSLNLVEKDFRSYFKEGKRRILDGQSPFDKDYPVSNSLVKDKLSAWRKSRDRSLVRVPGKRETKLEDLSRFIAAVTVPGTSKESE